MPTIQEQLIGVHPVAPHIYGLWLSHTDAPATDRKKHRQEGEKPGVPNIPKFRFKDIDSDLEHEILLCKRYEGENYLCSQNMRYKVHVKDSKNLPFSAVADIPGVFFKRDGYDWSMECHNPYVEGNL